VAMSKQVSEIFVSDIFDSEIYVSEIFKTHVHGTAQPQRSVERL
jgi:hypothetical protein